MYTCFVLLSISLKQKKIIISWEKLKNKTNRQTNKQKQIKTKNKKQNKTKNKTKTKKENKNKTKRKTKTKQANTLKVTFGAISLICDQKRSQLHFVPLRRQLVYCSVYVSVCFM